MRHPVDDQLTVLAIRFFLCFQKFRDSNPFGPQSDIGRLTVLNSDPVFTNPPRRDQFRDQSNQFGTQSNAGRLTVLNSGSSRQPPLASQPRKSLVAEPVFTNPPRRDSFIPQSFSDPFTNPQDSFPESPIRSFAAVPAVPEPVEEGHDFRIQIPI